MQSNANFDLLTYLPGSDFQIKIKPYENELYPFVKRMKELVDENNAVASHQAFKDYTTYCRWPIRQMEYSFFIRNLPQQPQGLAIDAGSGVTPFPYLLAKKGWETISTDIEADQMKLLSDYGKAAYGIAATHVFDDMRDMQFPDQHFSLVTCVSVLEHLMHIDVPQALSELVRISKPGARLIITTDVYPVDHPHIPDGYGAFTAHKIQLIFSPLAKACGVYAPFLQLCEKLKTLSMEDLQNFWTSHWQPGFWDGNNRGYAAIGMVFDLPTNKQACQKLTNTLKRVPKRRAMFGFGKKLWV